MRGDERRTCEVIERAEAARRVGSNAGAGGNTVGGMLRWRYYVHYEGLDRRLDEWVGEDVLNEALAAEVEAEASRGTGSASGGVMGRRGLGAPAERRATRNMKRKADEINHVQSR